MTFAYQQRETRGTSAIDVRSRAPRECSRAGRRHCSISTRGGCTGRHVRLGEHDAPARGHDKLGVDEQDPQVHHRVRNLRTQRGSVSNASPAAVETGLGESGGDGERGEHAQCATGEGVMIASEGREGSARSQKTSTRTVTVALRDPPTLQCTSTFPPSSQTRSIHSQIGSNCGSSVSIP